MYKNDDTLDMIELVFDEGAKWRKRTFDAWQIAGVSIALNLVLVWYVILSFKGAV